jgi:hypothetical protein
MVNPEKRSSKNLFPPHAGPWETERVAAQQGYLTGVYKLLYVSFLYNNI